MNISLNWDLKKVELDLSNYVTKADLKNATGFNTLNFAKNTALANLKSDTGKLDISKLKKYHVA